MITQALVANGAKVYVTGRREDKLENAIKQYSTGPGEILPLAGDISNKDDIQRLVKEIEQKEPKGIQLLVNNAGIARDENTKFCEYIKTHTYYILLTVERSIKRSARNVRPKVHFRALHEE